MLSPVPVLLFVNPNLQARSVPQALPTRPALSQSCPHGMSQGAQDAQATTQIDQAKASPPFPGLASSYVGSASIRSRLCTWGLSETYTFREDLGTELRK